MLVNKLPWVSFKEMEKWPKNTPYLCSYVMDDPGPHGHEAFYIGYVSEEHNFPYVASFLRLDGKNDNI